MSIPFRTLKPSFKTLHSITLKICTGLYPGSTCYDNMKNGSYDITFWPYDFVPLPDLQHFDPINRLEATIITPYDCSIETSEILSRKSDLIESISGFSPEIWVASISVTVIISILYNIHFRINRYSSKGPSNSGLCTVISFLLKNPSAKELNNVSRYLTFLTAIFAFTVFVCYFENVIKSDKVNVHQPFVYRSFEQLVEDPHVEIDIEGVSWRFERLPNDSKYRKILSKQRKQGQQTPTQTFDWLFSGKPIGKANIAYENEAMFHCRFCHNLLPKEKTYGKCMFSFKPEFNSEEYNFYDKYLKIRKAQMISDSFIQKPIFKKYYKYYRRGFEMNLLYPFRRLNSYEIPIAAPNCVPEKSPVTWDRDPEALDLHMYRYSFMCLLILLVLACVALNNEHYTVYLESTFSRDNNDSSHSKHSSHSNHISSIEIYHESNDLFTKTMIPVSEEGSSKDIDTYLEDIKDDLDVGMINELVYKRIE